MESQAKTTTPLNVITVQVCYVAPPLQFIKDVQLPAHAMIRDAILHSGVCNACPELDIETMKVGVYSKPKSLDTPLFDRDRVEIYRPLIVDPMTARRARAQKRAHKR